MITCLVTSVEDGELKTDNLPQDDHRTLSGAVFTNVVSLTVCDVQFVVSGLGNNKKIN